MIHTKPDFFNHVAAEIRAKYFADIKYYRDSEKCTTATYTIELFNNGCLTYRKLIGRLAKACNDTTAAIHEVVSKYIVSFGDNYEYKPNKASTAQ